MYHSQHGGSFQQYLSVIEAQNLQAQADQCSVTRLVSGQMLWLQVLAAVQFNHQLRSRPIKIDD